MNLNNIVVVLDHPDESRNIGAACRAMANNDINELRLVGKKEDYDIEHIHVLAIHAGGIFDKAKFYSSIKEATADCTICAGTTRRSGKKRGKLLLPEEFADQISSVSDENTKIALVFGNERTGLTDEQLDECVDTIIKSAYTGKIGDGKIFISDVCRVIRIRTGEENDEAI